MSFELGMSLFMAGFCIVVGSIAWIFVQLRSGDFDAVCRNSVHHQSGSLDPVTVALGMGR
ncbi:MAG: hypothetical protein JKX69_13570 [Rhodobacteraceae bacterium]|nr:hypothetical protein [Paracoccaceae bacterium]